MAPQHPRPGPRLGTLWAIVVTLLAASVVDGLAIAPVDNAALAKRGDRGGAASSAISASEVASSTVLEASASASAEESAAPSAETSASDVAEMEPSASIVEVWSASPSASVGIAGVAGVEDEVDPVANATASAAPEVPRPSEEVAVAAATTTAFGLVGGPPAALAAPKDDLDDGEEYEWEPGTENNAQGVGSTPPAAIGLGLTDMSNPNPRPSLPKTDCVYTWVSSLGWESGLTAPGGRRLLGQSPAAYLNVYDVDQGGIGNCGMGAAVSALIATKKAAYLARTVKQSTVGGVKRLTFTLYDMSRRKVDIITNDMLPKRKAGQTCKGGTWLGYQPGVARKGASSTGLPQQRVMFMPLFEKVMAKFLDIDPRFRSSTATKAKEKGYGGTRGVGAHHVLAAVTGGKPKKVTRTKAGQTKDKTLFNALTTCRTKDVPCVISFGEADLALRGPKNAQGGVRLPLVSESATVAGWAYMNPSGKSIRVRDYDNPNADGTPRTVTVITHHVYAFDRLGIGMNKRTKKTTVRLINPHGKNADTKSPYITLSLRVFLSLSSQVYTLESLPKL